VAVLGCGLCHVYPPENAQLAQRIAAAGALVSEFPMRTQALPGHFPRRNRIIAGLSAGVVVVEAAERSGALITAARALDQGREVFAVPGPVDERSSVGANRLIRAGACLVENAADVIEELEPAWGPFGPERLRAAEGGAEVIPHPADNRRGARDRDDGSEPGPARCLEERVMSHLSLTPVSVDALISLTGANASEILSTLLRLELAGSVEKVQGHSYIIGARARASRAR
jgi:DNA processing protein